MISHLLSILALLGLYIALTANLELSNLVTGILVSTMILALLHPKSHNHAWQKMPIQAWALIRYIILMIIDLIQSGIVVARIVLRPKVAIQPGILAIPMPGASEPEQALIAHALTLTPGELVVETGEDGTLFTHCLNATQSQETILKAKKLRGELLEKILK
jgi:multicomponent Na+:H+ antiporter subunit E